MKLLRLQPSELDAMEFYRTEFLLDNIKEYNEREKEQRKKDEDDQQKSMPNMDPQAMMRQSSNMFNNSSGLAGLKMPSGFNL